MIPQLPQVVKKVPVEKKKTEDSTSKWTECDVCHEMFETPTLAIQVQLDNLKILLFCICMREHITSLHF